MEKKVVKMEEILLKMEKVEKMEKKTLDDDMEDELEMEFEN